MKPSLLARLEALELRLAEVNGLLSSESATRDLNEFRRLTREHAELSDVVGHLNAWRRALGDRYAAQALRDEPEMREFADEELAAAEARITQESAALERLLLPKDPDDDRNADPGNPRGHRRRRVGAVRGRPAADVPALRRTAWLAYRDRCRPMNRTWAATRKRSSASKATAPIVD
jgi:hypothetical protein